MRAWIALAAVALPLSAALAQEVQVRRGIQPVQAGPTQLGPGALSNDPSAAAAQQARSGRLEEEIRRLTGRIEELEYQQQQVQVRLDKLVGDVDRRLTAVEGGSPPPAPIEPEPQAAVEPRASAGTPPPGTAAADARQGRILGTIPPGAVARLPRPDPSRLGYDGALSMLQAGRYPEAEQAFTAFIEENPKDPKASTAAYWIAESYYARKDYRDAAAAFARNYKAYGPDAPKAPDNLLKMGMTLAALGEKDKACQTFAELAKRHGNASTAVKQALGRERGVAGCS